MSDFVNDALELALDIDLGDIKQDELEGSKFLPAGKYHCKVDNVDIETGEKKAILLTFEVLGGTTPKVAGRRIFERLRITPNTTKRLALIATRFGLLKGDDFGKKTRINWGAAKGKHCVVELVDNTFTREDGTQGANTKVPFGGIYPLGHKNVADTPLNTTALADDGIEVTSNDDAPGTPGADALDDL